MSDFTYSSWQTYTTDGNGFVFGDSTDGALVDQDNDDQFETGDTPLSPSFGTLMNYLGTIDIGGTVYPVFHDPSYLNLYWLFAQSDGELPASITPANINTGATYAFCFAAGTMIATRDGETAVEALQIGDPVRTADGRDVLVKWVGRQTVFTLFRPAERLMPVRFAAGSLGGGLPHADLTVTADHAMLVDGVLCNAGALVNGTTITRVPLAEMGDSYTVYHVETEDHEIILANGAPAETFIDNVSRRVFDNFAEFEALYGDVPEMVELPLPRALSARQVPAAIRARLAGTRAA